MQKFVPIILFSSESAGKQEIFFANLHE